MSKSIWKFPLDGGVGPMVVEMPKGAEVLNAQIQGTAIVVWALVDIEATEGETRSFRIYGTGWADVEGRYISTIQDGQFVWHVYEVTN